MWHWHVGLDRDVWVMGALGGGGGALIAGVGRGAGWDHDGWLVRALPGWGRGALGLGVASARAGWEHDGWWTGALW